GSRPAFRLRALPSLVGRRDGRGASGVTPPPSCKRRAERATAERREPEAGSLLERAGEEDGEGGADRIREHALDPRDERLRGARVERFAREAGDPRPAGERASSTRRRGGRRPRARAEASAAPSPPASRRAPSRTPAPGCRDHGRGARAEQRLPHALAIARPG